jgi:serine/threonine-protein kinase
MVDGRYRIVALLGSGGMADVYCADDTQLGRRVALKILYGRFAEDDEFVERFRREASHAAALQHQNVVAVYDRGEWDGTSYIAMEYVDGRTLKQIVLSEGPIEPLRAIDIAQQILRAARFAHRRGVIHRDLKPHNVIVDEEDRAKVTDFGIARAGASDMTQTGSIMGTAQYLSPEQAQGRPVTPQSDLYSIGIVLYEMLTGQVPFNGDSPVSIALKQVNERPVPPSELTPGIPPVLEAVVLRALAKEPADRYADADAFIAALDDAKHAIEAGVAAAGVGAVSEDTAAFAAPLVAYDAPPPSTSHARPMSEELWAESMPPGPLPPAPPRTRRRWPWLALLGVLLAAAAVVAVVLLTQPSKVRVPGVVGRDATRASQVLHADGLEVETTSEQSDQPRNQVLSQDPPAGASVDEGSTVVLTVSGGQANVQVPDVTDFGRAAAAKALRHRGFKVQTRYRADDKVAKDHVISTSPEGGTASFAGFVVTMYVSSGPQVSPVPDVGDKTLDQATADLHAANFQVKTVTKESDQPEDTVLKQDPPAGASRPEGSTITLTIAAPPTKVAVPDVTGQTVAEASAQLGSSGNFVPVVRQRCEPPPDPSQAGLVVRQTPQPDEKRSRGATVFLVVGCDATPTPTTPATTVPTTPLPPTPTTP